MARRTFTRSERDAFTPGTSVEFRDGRTWRPGEIVRGPYLDSLTGGWYTDVRVTSRRDSSPVRMGDIVCASPSAIRVSLPVFRVGDVYDGGDLLDGRIIVGIQDESDGHLSVELANGEVWTVNGRQG